MRYSCNLDLVDDLPVPEQFRLAAEAGFACVNLGSDAWRGKKVIFAEECARVRAWLHETPIQVDWFHAPFIWPSFDTLKDEHRFVSLAAHSFYLERAAELEAGTYVIHPYFNTLEDSTSRGAIYDRVLEAVAELATRGAQLGVRVAVENMPYPEHHELVDHLLDNVPPLGFCLDAGHAHILNNWSRWQRHLPRLACMHLHDNPGDDDSHLYPGDGTLDWTAFRNFIGASGYAGAWGLEILWHGLDAIERTLPPQTRIRKAFAAARMAGEGMESDA